MTCPNCGYAFTIVTAAAHDSSQEPHRTRHCTACGFTFETVERFVMADERTAFQAYLWGAICRDREKQRDLDLR